MDRNWIENGTVCRALKGENVDPQMCSLLCGVSWSVGRPSLWLHSVAVQRAADSNGDSQGGQWEGLPKWEGYGEYWHPLIEATIVIVVKQGSQAATLANGLLSHPLYRGIMLSFYCATAHGRILACGHWKVAISAIWFESMPNGIKLTIYISWNVSISWMAYQTCRRSM